MSEHTSLWQALLAFKLEAPALPKDKVNPHFKSRYTPLDTIAERIDPLLTKHGLVWTTLPGQEDGRPVLAYRLAHGPSGEVLSGSMPLLLDKNNSQGLGSALTYARRYAKTAVLDLVADEDDDGNAASRPAQAPARATNGNDQPQRPALPDASVKIVLDAIKEAARGQEWLRGELVALGVESVPDGPVTKGTIQSLTPAQANELVAKCEKARA